MKKTMFLTLSTFLLGLVSCSESVLETPQEKPEVTARGLFPNKVEICWNEEGQTIDGFGVAQADWATSLFTHSKRDEVAALLFGSDGLNVNMLRGEIFPHYWENENDTTFNTDDNVDMPLSDPYFNSPEGNDLRRRGQLWVSKVAQQRYHVDNLIFSTWTPPAFMKSNGSTSKGSLKPEYYQRFAEYLAKFYKAYKDAGLNVYSISPVNEPNYETADWNSCKWTEQQLADFIVNNMGPTFRSEGVNAKIMFGELAQWHEIILGSAVSAKSYVEKVIQSNPKVTEYAHIAAGHGYNLPNIDLIQFPIVPWDVAASKGLKVWLTEISTTMDTFDPSIGNGVYWAEVFYKYLVDAKVNAICWWAGARPADHNEPLIQLNDNSYVVTKRFDTYGNYTRYIKPGSVRINAKKGLGVSYNLLVSSFKKDNQYIVVAVNKSSKEVTTTLNLKDATTNGTLKQYLTDANNRWTESEVQRANDGTYSITLPPSSVVTYIGTAN